MSKKTYAELLKDPRWQKKRLEVMKRADFKCQHCGDDESTLHVHHGYYEKSKYPWEYPDFSMRCLCEGCHEERQSIENLLHVTVASLSDEELHRVIAYSQAIAIKDGEYRIKTNSPASIEGLSDAHKIPFIVVQGNLNGGAITGRDLSRLAQG